MCRLSRVTRQTSRNHPTSPRSLEDLSLPPEYIHSSSGESLLLWDSGYTAERQRSFLFGTPANTSTLMEADHLVIDGTFKSAPQLMTQMVGFTGSSIVADTSPWRMDSYPEKPKHYTPLFWRTLTPLDPITLSQCFVTMSSLYTTPSLTPGPVQRFEDVISITCYYFHYMLLHVISITLIYESSSLETPATRRPSS